MCTVVVSPGGARDGYVPYFEAGAAFLSCFFPPAGTMVEYFLYSTHPGLGGLMGNAIKY